MGCEMRAAETEDKPIRKVRSPELERLIRTLEMVGADLPRIMRKEKELAFSELSRVDLFEAHMREMSVIPSHLEALARVLDRSLQVGGGAAHLSHLFRSLYNFPTPEGTDMKVREPFAKNEENKISESPALGDHSSKGVTTTAAVNPSTGDVISGKTVTPYHPIDLHLERVRNAIVPGGEVCGRSMYESSQARLVTARASGEGPWRFQFRKGSLEWAAEAQSKGLRGVAALICADIGYVQIPARLLLERARDRIMRSSGGNPVLRPSVAVFGADAILHPGAMTKTRPGDATKHVFVEF